MNAHTCTAITRLGAMCLLALLGTVNTSVAAQQTGTLAGTIVEAASLRPLAGAEVVVSGTYFAAVTDSTGNYRLTGLRPGEVELKIALPGYVTIVESHPVHADRVVFADFELVRITTVLDELVVTGDPLAEPQRRVSGRVDIVAGELLERAGAITTSEALSARMPGAEVLWTDGQVGAGVSLLLRGMRSVSPGTEPLVFVDGVRLASSAAPRSGVSVLGGLDLIDPSAIERIEVLRGPETARYGTGSANGVILIFTKRGSRSR